MRPHPPPAAFRLTPWLVALFACAHGVPGPPPSLPAAPVALPTAPVDVPSSAALDASAPPPSAPFAPLVERLHLVDDMVDEALRDAKLPGCVVVIGRHDEVLYRRAFGSRALLPAKTPMTPDTVFDVASLTKAVATATSVMVLVDRGVVALDEPVARYVPEFGRNGKFAITVRDLLTHVGGLPPDTPFSTFEHGPEGALRYVYGLAPHPPPRTQFVYSDVGYMVLGELVRRVSGEDLATFSKRHVFAPLGMDETTFNPGEALRERAAPTEMRDGHWMQGEVHDPRAYKMRGVAGHAGLFSTGDDLARFAQALLRGGELGGARVLSERAMQLFTAPTDVPGGVRAAGWDIRSPFSINRSDAYSWRAFGHGGFTGTSLWIDPEHDVFVVFLSNRVHPDGKGNVNALAAHIGGVAVSVVDPPPASAPSNAATCDGERTVLTGIDVLARDGFRALRGARVGLITNVTGRARDGTPTADLLAHAAGVDLVALFTPEHGAAAAREGRIDDGRDEALGIPVYSLYGANLKPTEASLRGIDTLVFDVQDVGTRFYTYASTMLRAMQAAADARLRFVVLDRPNPIDGVTVDGPLLDPAAKNFANSHVLPVRHGMTIGELAEMFDADDHLGVNLDVVRMEGWRREAYFEDSGLTWVNPSPNLRSVSEAVLYPAVGLLEATNLSVGRGTETPFEVVGAPWIDGVLLATELAKEPLPGVVVEPTTFTPDASNYKGERCAGVRLWVTDRHAFQAVRTGLAIAKALFALYPDAWHGDDLAKLVASPKVEAAVRAGKPLDAVVASWDAELSAFRAKRAKYLLYATTPCAR